MTQESLMERSAKLHDVKAFFVKDKYYANEYRENHARYLLTLIIGSKDSNDDGHFKSNFYSYRQFPLLEIIITDRPGFSVRSIWNSCTDTDHTTGALSFFFSSLNDRDKDWVLGPRSLIFSFSDLKGMGVMSYIHRLLVQYVRLDFTSWADYSMGRGVHLSDSDTKTEKDKTTRNKFYRNNGYHMKNKNGDLVDFSDIENGHLNAEFGDFDIDLSPFHWITSIDCEELVALIFNRSDDDICAGDTRYCDLIADNQAKLSLEKISLAIEYLTRSEYYAKKVNKLECDLSDQSVLSFLKNRAIREQLKYNRTYSSSALESFSSMSEEVQQASRIIVNHLVKRET